MKFWMRFAVVAAALFPNGSAVAQAPQSDAIDNWSLEPSPERCVISRRYGSVESPMTLAFKAPPIGDAVQIVIIRSGRLIRLKQHNVILTMGTTVAKTTAFSYPLEAGGRRVAHLINLPGADFAALRRASDIDVKVTSSVNRSFSLGPMVNAWTQLDGCLEKLRQTWNLTDTQKAGLASAPQPIVPLHMLFSSRDYPNGALWGGRSGKAGVVLLVDETGAVKDCTLTQTSGNPLLDIQTCRVILARAKFAPATDLHGKPVKGAIEQQILWQMAR
jgi:hypothetical protein